MKILILTLSAFCFLNLNSMHTGNRLSIGDAGNQSISPCSDSLLSARQISASIEQSEAARKARGIQFLATIGTEALNLIDKLKKENTIGDKRIDEKLQTLLKNIKENPPVAEKTDNFILQNPDLCAKWEIAIVTSALLVNELIRSSETTKT